MPLARTNLTLPGELLHEIDELAGAASEARSPGQGNPGDRGGDEGPAWLDEPG